MAQYTFVTNWRFSAPVERIWDEIYYSDQWPQWWKAVESVTLLKSGNESGIGSVRRYTWRGVLPYRLTFDMQTSQVEKFSRIEGFATGELQGRGCWHFSTDASSTLVRYDWEVETSKRWMQLLSPIARPLFEWNHDTVMRWGAEGLTQRLNNAKATRTP